MRVEHGFHWLGFMYLGGATCRDFRRVPSRIFGVILGVRQFNFFWLMYDVFQLWYVYRFWFCFVFSIGA